jgi:ribosome-associated translation inhibitor RaiA
MDIKVVVRGVENGDAAHLREFVLDKLAPVVERYEHAVLDGQVRIEDVTGPEKRGVDKLCHIELRLRSGEVRIKELGEDFKATINVALDRLRSVMSREVAKAKHGVGEG